ncbi:MAG: hypothetical protein ABL995_16770 [Bryobacteraceae bacterium]
MKKHWIQAGILAGSLALSSAAFAQGGRGITAHDAKNDTKPFDKHDLNGIWSRNGSPGGYGGGGTCRDCGDRGFGNDTPPFTALGQKMFDLNKPSYGRNLGSPEAAAHPEEHIGRRRAVPPVNGTDPYQWCNPMGVTRALVYPDPVEFYQLKDRVVQHFEWGQGIRTIWTDGREPLKDPDIPRWWGYSTGKWEGDTFVVDTYGFDERTWVDHFGYPHSTDMHLTERYKRTYYDTLELQMTIDDPKVYTKPWSSQLKKFRLIEKPKTLEGWQGLMEDICAPIEDVDQFNKRIRDPAGGVVH